MKEKQNYLISHQELWPEMGQAGRKYVEDNYDLNKLNEQLVNVYRQLMDGKLLNV